MYKAVLFDAYGTLLDVDAAAAKLAATGRFPELKTLWPELAAIWRSRQLNYTWLRSLSHSYAPFWQLTCDSLDYALESLQLDNQEMRDALLDLYRELDAYDDARPALDAVHEHHTTDERSDASEEGDRLRPTRPPVTEGEEELEKDNASEERCHASEDVVGGGVIVDQVREAASDEPPLTPVTFGHGGHEVSRSRCTRPSWPIAIRLSD